jgi:inorganic pyrophosphatase
MRVISHFFSIYKDLEGKRTQMLGWKDAAAARAAIMDSYRRFAEAQEPERVEAQR